MINDLPFEQVWFVDFEFVSEPGEHPDVVCLAAHELRSGQTVRLWRDELGTSPPYRTDAGALFVCYVANAELACHLALGWPLPANVLDLSPEFRGLMNGRKTPSGKGLLGALAHFGIDSISTKWKDTMRKRIMQGWPFTEEERKQILAYCASDIEALAPLTEKLLPTINLATALYRGESIAVAAVMEHRGVPIDMAVFPQLQDKDAWTYVRDAMVPMIDAKYGVYVKGKSGEWSFNVELMEAYLARNKIGWPRLDTGKLNLQRKTFDSMCKAYPQIDDLRQLRYARDKMRRIKLAVGADGRNRTVLWPFQSKTSRTQPKASQWIFSPAVWLRSLIKPGLGRAVAYVDYSSMEFLIAAALSDGHCGPNNPMLEMYQSGDPYLSFAKRVAAAPAWATKKSHGELRDRYKVGLLAIQYGIQPTSLAVRIGTSTFEAHEMLNQHRELFAQYWQWSDDWLQRAFQAGTMSTVLGWECRTGTIELNERSIRNFPVQANGAEILRIACIMMQRHGIELLAPVHDAVLIEAPIEHIEAAVALTKEIMRRASRIVLNVTATGTIELRTDASIIECPDRYSDKRGAAVWDRVLGLLAEYEQKKGSDNARRTG